MLTEQLVDLLWCPTCRDSGMSAHCSQDGDRMMEGQLRCNSCGAEFEVHGGIPHLKPLEQVDEEAWETWRDHLKGFEARREIRKSTPSNTRSSRWSQKLRAFADFVQAPEGNMLDVGCGPGNLRKLLDSDRVTYHGIDPIPVEEVAEFPFVCGIAEFLPFRSGTFSSVVVRSALDHFCDLNAFFQEASRILSDDGCIYLEQVVHGGYNVKELTKNAVHMAKDVIDDLKTWRQRNSAPKHMREFSQDTLLESIQPMFSVRQSETYTSNWYTPTQVFVCLERS